MRRLTFLYETQTSVALFPRPALRRGLSCVWSRRLTFFAYLDEFGHVGPYISPIHPTYKESPVFGLAGFVLPSEEVKQSRGSMTSASMTTTLRTISS